jgi:AcrR family transcriptional regulator
VLTAVEELLREGATFTELGVGQIAKAAGMSRSTFYLYFPDKTELLVRLSVTFKLGIFDMGRDWRPDAPAEGGLGELTEVYRGVVTRIREHAGLLAAVTEVAGYDPAVRRAWTGGEEQFVARIAQRLAAEQQASRTEADFDPQRAAQVMVWGCEQVIVRQVLSGRERDDAQVVAELAEAHWYGTFRRPAAQSDPAVQQSPGVSEGSAPADSG